MSERLTEEQEKAIREAVGAATQGPWSAWSQEGTTSTGKYRHSVCRVVEDDREHVCVGDALGATEAAAYDNAAFIALARNTVPLLLAEIDALRVERELDATVLQQVQKEAQALRKQVHELLRCDICDSHHAGGC